MHRDERNKSSVDASKRLLRIHAVCSAGGPDSERVYALLVLSGGQADGSGMI